MQKIVLLLCFFILHTASALKCFSCQGPGCDTDIETWSTETCPAFHLVPEYQFACIKWSYTDETTQTKVVERMCLAVELKDGKPNYNCEKIFGYQTECSGCQTDFCNSAKSISFSFVALCGLFWRLRRPSFCKIAPPLL